MAPNSRIQAGVLVLCVGAFVAIGTVYVFQSLRTRTVAPAPAPAAASLALEPITGRPHIVLVQPSGADPYQNEVAVAPLDALDQRVLVGQRCLRVHFSAGHGVCAGHGAAATAVELTAGLGAGPALPAAGLPSRARVSPDGRRSAITVFVTGHGYSGTGFSTQTTIHDFKDGSSFDLEKLTVTTERGERMQGADFNYWGVTFKADSRGFYATLGTGGHAYLIEGDAVTRQARVIRDGVECPSLSPDGRRIAYKSPISSSGLSRTWRLHVLDLAAMRDTPLSETRSIDDQAEWLDSHTILYGLNEQGPPATLDMNIWSLDVDSLAAPRLYLAHAASPAVVRPGATGR